MNDRNIDILKRIINYCNEIEEAMTLFGTSFESLESSRIYRNAVSMCILQIGELTVHLSDDFKADYSEMPWQDIKDMRNIAAHHYGTFDTVKLWETITADIPSLQDYCEKALSELLQS